MLPCAMACAWAPHLLSPVWSLTIACTPFILSDAPSLFVLSETTLFCQTTYVNIMTLHAAVKKAAVDTGSFSKNSTELHELIPLQLMFLVLYTHKPQQRASVLVHHQLLSLRITGSKWRSAVRNLKLFKLERTQLTKLGRVLGLGL